MRVSLVSSVWFLATWRVLAVPDKNVALDRVRREFSSSRRLLRTLDDSTEAPSMASNPTNTLPPVPPPEGSSGEITPSEPTAAPSMNSEGISTLDPTYIAAIIPATSTASPGSDGESNSLGDTTQNPDGSDSTQPPSTEGSSEGENSSTTIPNSAEGESTPTATPTVATPTTVSPTSTSEDSPTTSGIGSPTETPTVMVTPTSSSAENPSPSPTQGRTEYPTAGRPPYDDFPFPTPSYETPTYSSPTAQYPHQSPSYTPPTTKPYVPKDDDENDPIVGPGGGEGSSGSSTSGGYAWDNSTVEELEHDQTVIIALSVVFGVMFIFSVIVAHQMLENPHGCCASICRITVACFCALLRFFCYPCRAIFGCTGKPKRDHMIVPDDHGNYTHDLELS